MGNTIAGESLINYSKDKLERLIRPGVVIKHIQLNNPIILTGKETVELALGGELKKNKMGEYSIGSEREPSGIRLLDGTFIGIRSIVEIQID